MSDIKELKETDLNKVSGGAYDWKMFSEKYLNSITSSTTLTTKHKEMIEAIKDKDYIRVATLALPLIATDPLVAKIYFECM